MIDEKLCNSCKHRWEPEHQSSCWGCHDNGLYESEQAPKAKVRITNYERIRAMSVDEMADFLCGFCLISERCEDCPLEGICPHSEETFWWELWLLSESEVDK